MSRPSTSWCACPTSASNSRGAIVPLPQVEWGDHGAGGWDRSREAWVRNDGSRWVQTNQPLAELRLPAPLPRARSLELDLWCPTPAGGETAEVLVRLNGTELGKHALGRQPGAPLVLETPAVLWLLGENRLELEMPAAPAGRGHRDQLGTRWPWRA